MQIRLATALIASILAGCASQSPDTPVQRSAEKNGRAESNAQSQSNANTLDGYKRDLAMRISQMNSNKVYSGRPQALLRSVVVLRYAVDEHGQLVRSEIMRSNRDRETEKIALATLQNSAPFPKPASHLVRNGRLDISETWLFNNDGRFQLRTIAEPQMDR
ncbi:MAG TPA: hypothetical protein VJ654_01055 [Noviherbaspirillum sp.]|nr:hypothetical protein [Noviherbaspirillum sp.]